MYKVDSKWSQICSSLTKCPPTWDGGLTSPQPEEWRGAVHLKLLQSAFLSFFFFFTCQVISYERWKRKAGEVCVWGGDWGRGDITTMSRGWRWRGTLVNTTFASRLWRLWWRAVIHLRYAFPWFVCLSRGHQKIERALKGGDVTASGKNCFELGCDCLPSTPVSPPPHPNPIPKVHSLCTKNI